MREEAVVVLRLDTGDLPAKTAQAAQAIGAIGKTGEISARQTAAAMRQLPAQFTDIATQLAGGQNPLLILLQQGGQIKDSFGGVGAAVRGIAAAISPAAAGVGTLTAGVGALGLAAYQGAQQSAQLRDTIALTGNAAGLTADRVKALAESTAAASGQTVGSAREIALALAATGRTSAGVIESQATAAARIADLSGESATKIAATFASQLKAPAKFAAELNESYNFLTVAQFKRIQQLEREGKAVDAARMTNELLTKSLSGQRTELGYLAQALEGTSKWWSRMWDAALNFGRDKGPTEVLRERLMDLRAILVSAGGKEPAAGTGSALRAAQLREQIEGLVRLSREQEATAAQRSADANRNREGIAKLMGGDKPAEFGAIRTAREQYRSDFLRGEKDFYDEWDKLQKKAAEDARKDPLGEFIIEKVLPADQERAERRLGIEREFLEELRDTSRRAAAELIQDERQRGEALIALDLEVANRRLGAKGLSESGLAEARRLNGERADSELQGLSQRLGASTYDDVRGALAAAFRDSHNPARAFADALGNAIFTRVSSKLADALATAAVGRDGSGGLLGSFLGMIGSVAGGGYSVDTGGQGINAPDFNGTRGGMATGTNYVPRDMFALLHRGEAVVPAKYNQAGTGRAVAVYQNIQVAAGVSPADFAGSLAGLRRETEAAIFESISRPGRRGNNAMLAGL